MKGKVRKPHKSKKKQLKLQPCKPGHVAIEGKPLRVVRGFEDQSSYAFSG